jgi:hypothetical protein
MTSKPLCQWKCDHGSCHEPCAFIPSHGYACRCETHKQAYLAELRNVEEQFLREMRS